MDCYPLNKKPLLFKNTLLLKSLFAFGRQKIDDFFSVYPKPTGDLDIPSPPVFADAETYNLFACFVNLRSSLNYLLPYTLLIPLGVI